jgi:hypothetical protein
MYLRYRWDTPVHFGNKFFKSCENFVLMNFFDVELLYGAYKSSGNFQLVCHLTLQDVTYVLSAAPVDEPTSSTCSNRLKPQICLF